MKLSIRPIVVAAVGLIMSLSVSNAQSVDVPSLSEIETYAAAALAVQNVVEEYRDEAANTEEQNELDALRKEYSEALAEAVENEGMSVTRYNEIFQATQENPEVRERVEAAISEMES